MKKIINPWEGLDGYMCFGCAPSNPMGLHMEFYEDGDDIVAYWEPEAHYQGWLNTLHGELCTRADLVYFIVTQEQATEKFHFAGCKAEGE